MEKERERERKSEREINSDLWAVIRWEILLMDFDSINAKCPLNEHNEVL